MTKIYFISGTSKGIGLHLAKEFLSAGHTVLGCARSENKIAHGAYHHFVCDICDDAQIKKVTSAIRKKFGYVDVLINNAAIAHMNHFMLLPTKQNRDTFEVNVLANISLTREFAKLLKRSPNAVRYVLNYSSVAAHYSLPGQLAYSASKAAVESITCTASRELSEYNIRVNCVRLPYVSTSLSRTIGKERIENLVARQTLPEKCSLADVFHVTDYLTGEKADFITGEVLSLGGV